MTEYLTEQEQIELLKNWIKQYALVILAGVVIAIIAITGWRYWQDRQIKMLKHASILYDEMLTVRSQNNTAATIARAERLVSHYPKTIYGQMAALMLARTDVLQKDNVEAEKHLRWVLDQSHAPALRQIARLRLARLQIAEQKTDLALITLQKVDDSSFSGLIDEVRGDAYYFTKDFNKAREAYKLALSELPNVEEVRPLLQMKYDNLATLN